MKRLGFLLGAAVAFSAAAASARPNLWDVARDPRAAQATRQLVAIERMLVDDDSEGDPFAQADRLRGGIAMLAMAGAEELPDPRIQFLLGDLLIHAAFDREEEARTVLERALRRAPESPLAGRGWFNLAIAHAKLGNSKEERRAYTRALEVVWQPRLRANIHLNRGESNMVLGNLEAAIRDYREAIRLAGVPDLEALAHYGLGIALERSGDLPAALSAMRIAESVKLPFSINVLDTPGVFFVPDYDKHYYKALGAMAMAKQSRHPAAELRELERARRYWRAYLAEARVDKHQWVQNAELHLANIEQQIGAVARKVKREPRARPAAEDEE